MYIDACRIRIAVDTNQSQPHSNSTRSRSSENTDEMDYYTVFTAIGLIQYRFFLATCPVGAAVVVAEAIAAAPEPVAVALA